MTREPVLFGTCAWIARRLGRDVTSTRLVVASAAVLDPTFIVGLAYVLAGMMVGDGPPFGPNGSPSYACC